jgi:hypothetical protein
VGDSVLQWRGLSAKANRRSVLDSFLETDPLAKDTAARNNCRTERQPHQLLTNDCPFDAIGLKASTVSASDLAGFTARRGNKTHCFGSFQYDRTVQKLDVMLSVTSKTIEILDVVRSMNAIACIRMMPNSLSYR